MSWPTVVWAMGVSACLTLSAVHLGIGLRQRTAANLVFFQLGVSVAALAVFELLLMKSPLPQEHALLLRWIQVPLLLIVLSLVLFVRNYLRAGRPWLGWAAVGVRGLCVALGFLVAPNFNYTRITGVRPVRFLGETIFLTVGSVSGRSRLGQLASILLILFLFDATRAVWRRGLRERGPAAIVAASVTGFVVLGSGLTALTMERGLPLPYMISLCYLGVVAAMSYELGFEMIRASELARNLRTSEAALRESEERMSLAADAAGVEFWHLDASSGEFWLSEKARSLRGFAPDERVNRDRFLEPVHPEDREPLRAAVERAIRSGAVFESEYRVVCPDGETRWVASRGRFENTRDGSRRLRGSSVDITRRKVAELELARNRLDLAHLSRLTLLGELSGSLAHEINQPLAAILANAEAGERLLSRDSGNLEEIQGILADIIAADRHASEVISRLRVLLKKGVVELKPLRVPEVVQEALELLRSDLLNRRVSVFARLPPDLPPAIGDRTQIQQVVVNLVTNACDAMDEGTGQRWLSIRASAEGSGVLVSISDRGPGISPDALARLFEPFFTTKPHGLGLGLAVCRTIVAAHGGELWATNNPDGGATFHFTLRSQGAGIPAGESRDTGVPSLAGRSGI
jgi:two-component system, LuxR family, sensor kinase FixL